MICPHCKEPIKTRDDTDIGYCEICDNLVRGTDDGTG